MSKIGISNDPLQDLKNYALNSGYPFENDVESVIRALKYDGCSIEINRPEAFSTANEAGEPVIRSLDFRVTLKYPIQTVPCERMPRGPNEGVRLTFLVDAKYTSSDAWWFIPEPPQTPGFQVDHFPYLLPCYTDLTRTTFGHSRLLPGFAIPSGWAVASGGKRVAVGKRGNEQQNDRDSLTQHQTQMIQGVINRINQLYTKLGATYSADDHSYFRDLEVIFPIIVTNAPLYLMGAEVNTTQIIQATEAHQIATQKEFILVKQQPMARLKLELLALEAAVKNFKCQDFSWRGCALNDFPVIMTGIDSLGTVMQTLVSRFDQVLLSQNLR